MRQRRAKKRLVLWFFALAFAAGAAHFSLQALAAAQGSVSHMAPPTIAAPVERQAIALPARARIEFVSLDAEMQQAEEATTNLAGCPTIEEAYGAIARATEGADIAAISAALAEVRADPSGASGTRSLLAEGLRSALGLMPSAPVCDSVLAALEDAVQLAQVASIAEAAGPVTGSVGAPPPLSPSYSTIPPGTAGGARGHGYCSDVRRGCLG